MTARKLKALITKAADPDRPMVRPAMAGPDDARAVEHRGVERDRVADVLAADHLDRERLADGHVDRVHAAEQEREHDDHRDRGRSRDREDREDGARVIITAWTTISVGRFGSVSARMPANSPKIITGMNWAAATIPSQSGSWVSWSTSQAWATCCIHVPTSEIAWPAKNSR